MQEESGDKEKIVFGFGLFWGGSGYCVVLWECLWVLCAEGRSGEERMEMWKKLEKCNEV